MERPDSRSVSREPSKTYPGGGWLCPTTAKEDRTCVSLHSDAQRAEFPWCLCFRMTKEMHAVIKPCVQHCKIMSLYKTKSKDNLS